MTLVVATDFSEEGQRAGTLESNKLRMLGDTSLARLQHCRDFGLRAPAVWWAMNLSQLVQALILTQRFMRKKWFGSPKSNITTERTSV